MQTSSKRFKALAVTIGSSFWFFVLTQSIGYFTIEIFIVFIVSAMILTQIFAPKISRGLNIFADINTKIFLGMLFIGLISIYGIFFKILRIDLLRLKKQQNSYWLNMDKQKTIEKQY
ncbi:MAG: hypothetical protein R1F52_02255 [Candidatus Nitrosoabyssus spongiisocia]|nr:MAG: hypothetical protein R1F52_02255 [Nitrosopumilaceae archaeon AB1(1)]